MRPVPGPGQEGENQMLAINRSVSVRYLSALAVLLLAGGAVVAGLTPQGQPEGRIAVASLSVTPEPVQAWAQDSPQELVRIEGDLYQKDADFYYRVVDDTITVRLAEGLESWDELLAAAERSMPQILPLLEQLTPKRKNRLGILDLGLPSGGDPADWSALVHQTGLVRYAEVASRGVYLVEPDDSQFNQQWALKNTGQTGGTPGADLHAEGAWDLSTGDASVIVAVLDSGTDVDHPDLAPNVWHNDLEIPNNGADDDGNGFVDDWEGWDFGSGNNDPRSGNFHGTHVTGIINADADNGIGIAGLAGGFGAPGVRGMALGVGESGPIGSVLDDAIIYAADNGATVITMSLSVGSSTAISDALNYAYNTKDVFIDCAAGNNGSSVSYPATRAEVMAVASTTDNDNQSSFSNPGPQVEVAAPGSSILSTQPNGVYGTSSGTSFSAPYVAGLAALIRGLNPGLSAPDVRQIIKDSADDVESVGFDNLTGFGRINAEAALATTASSDGKVLFDEALYTCSGQMLLTLLDVDLAGSGTVDITLKSGPEASGETFTLFETGSGSGVFRGTIATSPGAPGADGALQTVHDDQIVAEYVDANDGLGGVNVVKTSSAATDCASPFASNISPNNVTETTAWIAWTTDEPSTAVVRYGETIPADEVGSPVLSTAHSVQLTGLAPCSVYRYEIESTDELGNAGVQDNAGGFFRVETEGVCAQGTVDLDRASYGCEDTIAVSVADANLNLDSGIAETVEVLVTSTSEPQGEWITLTEAGIESLGFDGSLPASATSLAGDGVLTLAPGDLISATYYDFDDGAGMPRTAITSSLADCSGPEIQNLRVTALTATRAEIEWTTSEPATSRVEYGTDAGLGSVVEDLTPVTSHRIAISAFEACERGYFRVSSVDALGNARSADASGVPFEFNLNSIGGLLFHDNFEEDSGWTLTGEWERAAPQGIGSASKDPSSAFSGGTVLGTDLLGAGAFPGDYEPSGTNIALSPPLDPTGMTNLELIFKRKLGVAAGDEAAVEVFAPGQNMIWSTSTGVNDADWSEVRYDIGVADNQDRLILRFTVESTDPGQSFGWNIDEIIVKDSTQPDYLTCGGCLGSPAFGGITKVFDPDPCGASGLTLEWVESAAWGSGAAGSYDVHRGTTPDFVPDSANRVATGITDLTWTDPAAPNDTQVWYVVRARNDENCGGGEGLADGNLMRLSATETASQPLPSNIPGQILTTRVGGAHVRLDWSPAPGAAGYVIRRSTSADFSGAVPIGLAESTFFEDENAAADGNFYAYRAIPVNSCGEEPSP